MRFYLGTHKPQWLADLRFASVPLFVSRRHLYARKTLPRALTSWALDSGGFTEIGLHGRWEVPPRQYVTEVRRFRDEVGRLDWAAPQDWMCEPVMLDRTGLTVEGHQARTVANFLELRELAPDLPWVPVLQGWTLTDYWRCADEYDRCGVELARLPLVGLGSVYRRQGGEAAARIVRTLAAGGLRLHGFGFKVTGLRRVGDAMTSADSLAWSYHARRRPPLPGHSHKNCANCGDYALLWMREILGREKGGEV